MEQETSKEPLERTAEPPAPSEEELLAEADERRSEDERRVLRGLVRRYRAAVEAAARGAKTTRFTPKECNVRPWDFAAVLRQVPDEVLACDIQANFHRGLATAELFFHRYRRRIETSFRGHGLSAHSAEDAAQELTMKVLRRGLGRYNPAHYQFVFLLAPMVRNMAIEVQRHDGRRHAVSDHDVIATASTLDSVDVARWIEGIRDTIPEPERGVFKLWLDGLNPKQIANTLHQTRNWVYYRRDLAFDHVLKRFGEENT